MAHDAIANDIDNASVRVFALDDDNRAFNVTKPHNLVVQLAVIIPVVGDVNSSIGKDIRKLANNEFDKRDRAKLAKRARELSDSISAKQSSMNRDMVELARVKARLG